jgi:polyhydroxyalkanoate synthase subunit PhaC
MATRQSTRSGAARNGRRRNGSGGAQRRGSAGNGASGGARGASARRRAGERPAREAVVKDVALGSGPRDVPGLATAKFAAKLALKPQAVARRGLGLATEISKVAIGRSELEPEKGDRRFKDKGWKLNPAFRRILQAYLATGQAVDGLIDDAALDKRSEQRVRFLISNLLDALAPSNSPLLNPTVLKAVIDSGGLNFVQGARQLATDMSGRPFLPASVDASQFEVGEDLGVTPGAVVFRNEVFELIQYDPQTEKVREKPLLLVPQMINKYYIADLSPGQSLLEWAVQHGQQTFAISWRNPDSSHADWNYDTYCQAVLDALDAVEDITGAEGTHLMGLCAGGTIATMVAGHLAARGEQDRLAGLILAVNVLDTSGSGQGEALLDDVSGALAMVESARKGYLSGKSLAELFAWMRPNDMIWGYFVNNYLLGQPPPAWDVLYWNNDTTNMPAAVHRDFVQLGLENKLVEPGAVEVLGTPIDLSKITVDAYLLAGIADHISPWESAYRTTQLLGSDPQFVLSTSGHIVAMVNPPGNDKANYKTNEQNPPDPSAWLKTATTHEGSWWPHWTGWLGERSGKEREAPKEPGSSDHPVLGEAPGTYVRQKA